LRRFGLKTDIYFAHFGQCMNVFVVSVPMVPDEYWERKSNIRNNMLIYEFLKNLLFGVLIYVMMT